METNVVKKLLCIKNFTKGSYPYESNAPFFENGIYYPAIYYDDNVLMDNYFVVYLNDKFDQFETQIFNSDKYSGPTKGIFPNINDYFVTQAEWRDKQINNILYDI